MLRLIIIAVVSWLVGIIGWAQIIGGLQNYDQRKSLIGAIILWIVIMAGLGYLAVVKFSAPWALAAGYFISFVQIKASGRIE